MSILNNAIFYAAFNLSKLYTYFQGVKEIFITYTKTIFTFYWTLLYYHNRNFLSILHVEKTQFGPQYSFPEYVKDA